jgi:hypothetical protein
MNAPKCGMVITPYVQIDDFILDCFHHLSNIFWGYIVTQDMAKFLSALGKLSLSFPLPKHYILKQLKTPLKVKTCESKIFF